MGRLLLDRVRFLQDSSVPEIHAIDMENDLASVVSKYSLQCQR